MTKEPVIGLTPVNDCVLVELKQSHKNFATKEGKYDTRSEGVVIAIDVTNQQATFANHIMGKRVHFEEFKEGGRIKRNGKIYSFIKIEDIRGYETE